MIYDDMIYDTCTWARVTHTHIRGGGGGWGEGENVIKMPNR